MSREILMKRIPPRHLDKKKMLSIDAIFDFLIISHGTPEELEQEMDEESQKIENSLN